MKGIRDILDKRQKEFFQPQLRDVLANVTKKLKEYGYPANPTDVRRIRNVYYSAGNIATAYRFLNCLKEFADIDHPQRGECEQMRNYIAVFANSGPLKLLEKRKVVPRRKIKK